MQPQLLLVRKTERNDAEIYPIHSCLSCFPFRAAFGNGYAFGKPKAAQKPALHFSTQCCCRGVVTFPTADGALM